MSAIFGGFFLQFFLGKGITEEMVKQQITQKRRAKSRIKNAQLPIRIVALMSNPETDGYTQQQLADALDISTSTLRRYLTEDVWKEIQAKRLNVMYDSLENIDQAVFKKAVKGDITAAKLIYSRWEVKRQLEQESPPSLDGKTLEELNDEIYELEQQIKAVEGSKAEGIGTEMAHSSE